MKLFDEYPFLTDGIILLRKIVLSDAEALQALRTDQEVYRYLPTFLYEQKYEDVYEVIGRMDEECFRTKESILLAVCLADQPDTLCGIAEIYAWEPWRRKASIGYRLRREYWGRGIATAVARLLREYLFRTVYLHTVTAHVMTANRASAAVLIKAGFPERYSNVVEDWGLDVPVLVDKYVLKEAEDLAEETGIRIEKTD
ncbi:MAG: GNAT family N-acetyltransferase [Solobacterium sp.]|nr:GNAT family N-acetyltransferase [Solobacterium sp.]